jgi:hypothetical protein
MKNLILLAMVFFASCSLLQGPSDSQPGAGKLHRPKDTVASDAKPRTALLGQKKNSQLRQRVLILPFLDRQSDHPEGFRTRSKEILVKELSQRGNLLVFHDEGIDQKAKDLIVREEYDFAKISQLLRDKGYAAFMEASILSLDVFHATDEVGLFRQQSTRFELKLRLRMGAPRSGRELMNLTKTVNLENSQVRVPESITAEAFIKNNPELLEKFIAESFLDFEPQIYSSLGRLNWEGRIALVRNSEIFLNVGKLSGVQIGDLLRVSEDGEEVFDPQTGNFIGKVPGKTKGTLEVVSYFGVDGAKAIIHSGAGFKENDRVELY